MPRPLIDSEASSAAQPLKTPPSAATMPGPAEDHGVETDVLAAQLPAWDLVPAHVLLSRRPRRTKSISAADIPPPAAPSAHIDRAGHAEPASAPLGEAQVEVAGEPGPKMAVVELGLSEPVPPQPAPPILADSRGAGEVAEPAEAASTCGDCGAELDADASFCSECGARRR